MACQARRLEPSCLPSACLPTSWLVPPAFQGFTALHHTVTHLLHYLHPHLCPHLYHTTDQQLQQLQPAAGSWCHHHCLHAPAHSVACCTIQTLHLTHPTLPHTGTAGRQLQQSRYRSEGGIGNEDSAGDNIDVGDSGGGSSTTVIAPTTGGFGGGRGGRGLLAEALRSLLQRSGRSSTSESDNLDPDAQGDLFAGGGLDSVWCVGGWVGGCERASQWLPSGL